MFNFSFPLANFKFENNLLDSAGNGNTGTINAGGTETYVAGIDDQAFDFDGLTHIVTTDAPFDFERDDSFSVSTWIKTDIQTENDMIFGKMTITGYQLFLKSDDQLRIRISNSNTDKIMVDTVGIDIRDDNWHHVVLTYDGSSSASGVTIYIDGTAATLKITRDNLTNTILNDEPFVIGNKKPTSNAFFTGQMDNVQVYNFELSDVQVADMFFMS